MTSPAGPNPAPSPARERGAQVDRLSVIEHDDADRTCGACGADITARLDASYQHGYVQGYEKRKAGEPDELSGAVDLMRESQIARARGLAQAISECRDDARLDGIREGAAEIFTLLGGQ
jgi:hypothetical protein